MCRRWRRFSRHAASLPAPFKLWLSLQGARRTGEAVSRRGAAIPVSDPASARSSLGPKPAAGRRVIRRLDFAVPLEYTGAATNKKPAAAGPGAGSESFRANRTSREGLMKAYLVPFLLLLAGPALAQQSVPEIAFDSVPDYPKLPEGMNFGEVPGVAVNSKGHVFVFTRSNSANGPAYGADRGAAARIHRQGRISCAKSARASMPGRSPIACASTRTTTSGPSTKAPT